MKQRLSWTNRILVGFTLFSMFFGAGNLIFPPFLGYLAGSNLWPAAAGFILSAVCLPVLGVAAVALAGGLDKLAGRVHPGFSVFFTVLIYLAIGPCVAIPRTAGTAYEMAVLPFLGELAGKETQLIFSVLFFCVMALCVISIVTVYGAVDNFGQSKLKMQGHVSGWQRGDGCHCLG